MKNRPDQPKTTPTPPIRNEKKRWKSRFSPIAAASVFYPVRPHSLSDCRPPRSPDGRELSEKSDYVPPRRRRPAQKAFPAPTGRPPFELRRRRLQFRHMEFHKDSAKQSGGKDYRKDRAANQKAAVFPRKNNGRATKSSVKKPEDPPSKPAVRKAYRKNTAAPPAKDRQGFPHRLPQLFFFFRKILLQRGKTFLTDHMFNPAGVLQRILTVYSQRNQKIGNKRMTFIHSFGDRRPFGRQRQ